MAATEINSAYEDLAQFLAGLSPRKILAYRVSNRTQERVNYLLEKNATTGLTDDENTEMAQYMAVEHIVRLAKAKALQKMTVAP